MVATTATQISTNPDTIEEAESPFGEDDHEAQTFEEVCLSLIDRGWKIRPKVGTYPLDKTKGPPYVDLIDPKRNRRTIHVRDPALWDKLREAQARLQDPQRVEGAESERKEQQESHQQQADEEEEVTTPVKIGAPPSFEEPELGLNPVQPSDKNVPRPSMLTEGQEDEKTTATAADEEAVVEEQEPSFQETGEPPILLNASLLQDLTRRSTDLEKLIQDIEEKVQNWRDPKDLVEYLRHEVEVDREESAQSTDKDSLISDLEATLAELEQRLDEAEDRYKKVIREKDETTFRLELAIACMDEVSLRRFSLAALSDKPYFSNAKHLR